jgi:dTDP-4-dehydrorhamnose reductase
MARGAGPHLPLEVWGGVECTMVRIGPDRRDEVTETGHRDRIEDLDAIAALGIRTLRYPVLWEMVSPHEMGETDWSWHDVRLARLRELGIAPIAGLVHHGSGPDYTDLLDPAFPELVAQHAARVAARYPWITRFTPVNEPLTTARFSGLYGHWHPHARDPVSFLRMLIHECRATVLAMRAIRAITPAAELIQTEDFGKTFSTPLLDYQAAHENERRWLTFDLLLGRVDAAHPMHDYLIGHGIGAEELAFFRDNPCPPDIIGINHYPTSERFLDHRRTAIRGRPSDGNGRHRYADLEAVRMDLREDDIGPHARLKEVWERYRLPMAVTEVHHGCTRDEQVRWLHEVTTAAHDLRDEGADIRAVTVWSLFGAVDWNSLLTRRHGHYEPGAFDARSSPPRRTALGTATASLAATGWFEHPVLDTKGWWRRAARFYRARPAPFPTAARHSRKLLITGGHGTLGRAFSTIAGVRGLANIATTRRDLDIADPAAVDAFLARHQPWAVVNTAGFVRVAEAETERDACFRENAEAAGVLAQACARAGIPLVTFSSDLVFSGELGRALVESDAPAPGGVYGASKAAAERLVLEACPGALVIRTSAFFGPWDAHNFVFGTLRDLSVGASVIASDRDIVSPTYVPDLVHAALDLLIDGETGLWHLANAGEVSWHGLARRVAELGGFDPALVVATDADGPVRNTALASEGGILLPPLDSGLHRFFEDHQLSWHQEQGAAAE